MHDSASLPTPDWLALIGRLSVLLGVDLDALALQTKALLRRRGVPDAAALLRLALVHGPGGLSLRQTAAWACLTGVANLTDASLNDRLHQSCDFLAEIVAGLLRAKVPGPCLGWPSRVLRISDGSCVSKPGSKGTDWRVHGVYDLGSGGFSHLELTDKHGGEALDRGPGIEGEIRIADRGYSAAKALRRFIAAAAAAQTVDYVVRLRWSSLRLSTPLGVKFDLIAHLNKMPAYQSSDDVAVLIEGAGTKSPLPARVVILRNPRTVIRGRRGRTRASAPRGQPARQRARSPQPARRRIRDLGDLLARRLSRRADFRHVPLALANRTRVQKIEKPAQHRPPTGDDRQRRTKLDICAFDRRLTDRCRQPGFPGIFPLRTSSTPNTRLLFGARKRPLSSSCAWSSLDASPWTP